MAVMKSSDRGASTFHMGSQQNPPSKHHYVPIFYSKWWAGPDGLVERFTKHSDVVVRRVHPSRVGWAKDLYKIPGEDQTSILEEQFFRRLDNVAASALRKMNATPPQHLSPDETTAWSIFMRALMHRTPEYMVETKRSGARIFANIREGLRERYPSLRSETDPVSFDEWAGRRTPEETERSILLGLPGVLVSERVVSFLNECHWVHFNIPMGERSLLLSDNPLARTDGLKIPGGHMAMPVSPRRLLIVARERETVTRIDRTSLSQIVRNMNRWTVQSAQHFVVATDRSQEPFIRKHFGADPKPAIMSRAAKE